MKLFYRIIYYLFIFPREKLAELELKQAKHVLDHRRQIYEEDPIWKENKVSFQEFCRRLDRSR